MKFWFVLLSGLAVLLTLVLCLVAAGTLRSGHPPGSGIVILAAFLIMGPISGTAALLGLSQRTEGMDTKRVKWFFMATGVNVFFALFCLLTWFCKSILGWTL